MIAALHLLCSTFLLSNAFFDCSFFLDAMLCVSFEVLLLLSFTGYALAEEEK